MAHGQQGFTGSGVANPAGQSQQHERNACKLTCLALCLIASGCRRSGSALRCCSARKAFQTVETERLQRVESLLGQIWPQLHTDWAASRPGSIGLIASYILSACRPTVAFPYLPIVLMLLVGRWLTWL
jgi:hypothetical protein